MNLPAEEWGADDPKVGVEGVHMMVLGGRSVWLLVLHQLVTASNHRTYLEHCLAQANFIVLLLEPW